MSKVEGPVFTWLSRLTNCLVSEGTDREALGLAAALNALLFALALIFVTPFFETNDDRYMQMIASGFFTGHPSEYLVFTHFLIGWGLRLMYGIWADCNWYVIYLLVVHYAAYTAIAFLVLSRRRSWTFVLLYIVFFLLVEIRILLKLQFTTTAFLAGTAGLLLLADGLRQGRPVHWGKTMVGMAFVALMSLIREPVAPLLALVALPFLVQHFGFLGWRRAALAAAVCVGLCLVLHGINRWYYQRDSAWAEFSEYNRLRSRIHDTPLNRLLPQAAPAVGWSQNDGWMFNRFFLSEAEVFGGVSRMRLLLERLDELAKPDSLWQDFSINPFLSSRHIWQDSRLLMQFAMLNVVWLLVLAGARWPSYLMTLIAFYGLFVGVSSYLLTTAKFPERVSYCLPLLVHAVCLYWASGLTTQPAGRIRDLWSAADSTRLTRRVRRVILPVWALLYVVLLWELATNSYYQNQFNLSLKANRQRILEPIRALSTFGQKPVLITMPCLSRNSMLEECLSFHPSPEKVPFWIVPYGWLTHSPLFRQVLEQHHLEPFSISTATRRGVFFLTEARWLEPLRTFYQEHYGLNVRFDLVVDINEIAKNRAGILLQLYQPRVVGSTTESSPFVPQTR